MGMATAPNNIVASLGQPIHMVRRPPSHDACHPPSVQSRHGRRRPRGVTRLDTLLGPWNRTSKCQNHLAHCPPGARAFLRARAASHA